MGARLSLLAPSAPTVAVSSYVDILNSIQFLELINNIRFLKTIKALDKTTGDLIIIKILIKSSDEANTISLQQVTELIAKQSLLLSHFPNVLPWHKLIETDRAGYLVRQLIRTNLYDRVSLRPFLQPIEKSFIVFQMLMVIQKIHEMNIYHGDLKLENFLITSWNWLLLTDFATYTKPVFIPEDNPNQFSFYFDNSGRRVCYLAPERFYDSKIEAPPTQTIDNNGIFTGKDMLTSEMDLFSLGCVIAEFYSDGEPTFTLSQIFKYIKGTHQLNLSNVTNEHVKEIISSLITLNPQDRISPEILLNQYRDKLFPGFFYDFLYDFMTDLNCNDAFIVKDPQHSTINDLKIEKIYREFDKIVSALDFKYGNPKSIQTSNSPVPYKLNLPGMPSNYTIKPGMFTDENSDNPSLIVLGMVFSMMKAVKQPLSKIKSCELILALSERINDESKLDRSLPYLCSIIDEFIEFSSMHQECSTKVVCTAIRCITTLLMSCSYITPINVLIFPEYLLPKLSNLVLLNLPMAEKSSIKITLAACLPYLASVSKKFWMMSKTFKHDTLKAYESKILGFSVGGGTNDYSTFSIPKDQLDAEFETITNSILTDFDISVKISLVNNILPLCQFFGVDKTNDIILPHLITYLNDSSVELKIAFLDSIIKISGYIGILTFEQYILPLLIQTLGDPEPFVILKVLEIFNDIVRKRLINPRVEFNALGIYTELLENTTAYLLHPIEWIRQSVLCLVVSISESLTDADRYCILYPLIKKFLKNDVSEITWNSLYPYLTKPLSRQLFEKTVSWAVNASNKSLFWQQVLSSAQSTRSNGNMLSFSNMGKSVYLPKNSNEISNLIANEKKTKVSLSPEDRHWIFKLRSVGFEENDLWKLYILRDYFYHISKVKRNVEEANEYAFLHLSNESNIAPRNIFIDINYKSEPLNINKTTNASVESTFNAEVASIQEHDSKGNTALVLPNIGRVKASIQTVEANVFGEMELSHESSSFHHLKNSGSNSRKENTLTHVLYSVNNSKIVTSNLNISYKGQNPFIINYLGDLDFEPDISNFPEFGSFIKTPINRDLGFTTHKATHLARINTNNSNDWVEGINKVIVSPSSEFFVTTSETGNIKVWDSSRIDRLVSARNASLTINLNSGITCIKFIPNRFVFAVGTMDGQIRLFRIEIVRGKNKKIIKYTQMKLIRQVQLQQDNEFVNFPLDFEFSITDKHSILLGTTSSSKIFSIDILRIRIDFEVEIPIFYGVPSTLVYGENSWVLVGTDKGILFLWDFRFKVLVKSWKLEEKQSGQRQKISKISLLPKINSEVDPLSFVIQCGTNITIWELPSLDCKQILTEKVIDSIDRKFVLTECDCKFDVNNLEDIFAEFDVNLDTDGDNDLNDLTAMNIFHQNKQLLILSATANRNINLWNMINFDKSLSITTSPSKFIQSTKNGSTIIKEFIQDKEIRPTNQLQFHQDIVTDLCIVTKPYEMVVSVDRSGLIQIFRLG